MRYYFDIRNADGLIRDEEGQQMSLRQGMRRAAAAIATDIARDEVVDQDLAEVEVMVRDEADQEILRTHILFKAEWLDRPPQDMHHGSDGQPDGTIS